MIKYSDNARSVLLEKRAAVRTVGKYVSKLPYLRGMKKKRLAKAEKHLEDLAWEEHKLLKEEGTSSFAAPWEWVSKVGPSEKTLAMTLSDDIRIPGQKFLDIIKQFDMPKAVKVESPAYTSRLKEHLRKREGTIDRNVGLATLGTSSLVPLSLYAKKRKGGRKKGAKILSS